MTTLNASAAAGMFSDAVAVAFDQINSSACPEADPFGTAVPAFVGRVKCSPSTEPSVVDCARGAGDIVRVTRGRTGAPLCVSLADVKADVTADATV
ncbi:MAG: hypothetical protein ACRYF3_13205, partial [Janthinobacterium lividum]